jgi:hypothetical protein
MVSKVQSIFVFVAIKNGIEQIMTWPNGKGENIPLIYLTYQGVIDDNMKVCVKDLAEKNKIFCELREYRLVPLSEEQFYPSQSNYNA